MAEETPASDPTVEAPAPAAAADDLPVNGSAAHSLDTPQKDTTMLDAPSDQPAVCPKPGQSWRIRSLTVT